MKLQQLLSYVRRACDDFEMIKPYDKIAVAVSGGKDSLALLAALASLKRFYPNPFDLAAITVDLGFPGFDTGPIHKWCGEMGITYVTARTDIGKIIFEDRAEKNPCSLCAKMRKGVLNNEALKMGCTRVAYGHNQDDILHTFLLSLFFEGRLHTLEPVTYLDRTNLYSIRPLYYVPEKDVIGFTRRYALPVTGSPCPANGNTKREEIKRFAHELRNRYDHFDAKVMNAIMKKV